MRAKDSLTQHWQTVVFDCQCDKLTLALFNFFFLSIVLAFLWLY